MSLADASLSTGDGADDDRCTHLHRHKQQSGLCSETLVHPSAV